MINEGVIDPFLHTSYPSVFIQPNNRTQIGVYIVRVNTNWKFHYVSGIVCAQLGGDIVCEYNSKDTMRTHDISTYLGSF